MEIIVCIPGPAFSSPVFSVPPCGLRLLLDRMGACLCRDAEFVFIWDTDSDSRTYCVTYDCVLKDDLREIFKFFKYKVHSIVQT